MCRKYTAQSMMELQAHCQEKQFYPLRAKKVKGTTGMSAIFCCFPSNASEVKSINITCVHCYYVKWQHGNKERDELSLFAAKTLSVKTYTYEHAVTKNTRDGTYWKKHLKYTRTSQFFNQGIFMKR